MAKPEVYKKNEMWWWWCEPCGRSDTDDRKPPYLIVFEEILLDAILHFTTCPHNKETRND